MVDGSLEGLVIACSLPRRNSGKGRNSYQLCAYDMGFYWGITELLFYIKMTVSRPWLKVPSSIYLQFYDAKRKQPFTSTLGHST